MYVIGSRGGNGWKNCFYTIYAGVNNKCKPQLVFGVIPKLKCDYFLMGK